MRRLITMLTGVIVLLAISLFPSDAKAWFYLIGQWDGDSNNWNSNQKSYGLSQDSDPKITIEFKNEKNYFRIYDDSGNNWGPYYVENDNNNNKDVTYNMSVDDTNTYDICHNQTHTCFVVGPGKYEIHSGDSWDNGNKHAKMTIKKLADIAEVGDKAYYYYVKTGDNWYEKKGELNKDNNYSITVNTTEAKDNVFFLSEESDKNGNWETIKSITVGPKANDTYWFKEQSETVAVSKQNGALMKYNYSSSTKATLTLDGTTLTVKYIKEITDMDLYLILWKDENGTSLGKFSAADEDGIKTLIPENEWETGTYDLFVASQIPLNTSGWTNWTAYMYNNGSDLNVTSNKWENMQKSIKGTYKVTVGSKGTVEFYINLSDRNGDTGMKFKAVPPVSPDFNGYFLSGDLNGWMKSKSYGDDASGANTIEEMLPYKFAPCTEKEMDGWYKLEIKPTKENKSGKMHGQFQILEKGDFHAKHWGHKEENTNDTYWNSPVSDNADNKTTMGYKDGNFTIKNHHIKYNYYKEATIYFNPDKNQCYIDGIPQNIYVYYYNQKETNPDNIQINMKSNGYTGVNYTVNPSLENATFKKGKVGQDGEMNGEKHEQLKELVGQEVLYAPVAPGLEESFWADQKEHYYNFGLQNADAVKEGETFVFNGDNIYFINYKLGSITLNLRDYNDDEMYLGQMYDAQGNDDGKPYVDAPIIEYIKARMIALDGNQARYVAKEEVSEGVNGRTNDPKEALTYKFDMHLQHNQNGFSHDIKGGYPNLNHWNGMHSAQDETVVKEPTTDNWADEVVTIPLAHSNRYVELEVKLTDLEDFYHGTPSDVKPVFLSNFDRTVNEDGTVTLTMKQVDTNAHQVMARADVAPSSTDFKLDGSHKYFTYKFEDSNVVTGIKDIVVDGNVEGNAEAVYYTLQGVKTDKPVKGRIYIVVRGNKSSKVVY